MQDDDLFAQHSPDNPFGMAISRRQQVSTRRPRRFSIKPWPMKQSLATEPASQDRRS
jgi:hypothetical protein